MSYSPTTQSDEIWLRVEDCYHGNDNGAPEDGSALKETGGGYCDLRIVRGGSWGARPEFLRASFRGWIGADYRSALIGFRLVQDIE